MIKEATKKLALRLPPLKRLVAERDRLRAELEGLRAFVPPGHFYSPVNAPEEVSRDAERIFKIPESVPGVDLNVEEQLRTLEAIKGYYAELPFKPERSEGLRYYFDNPMYSYSDAICLYGMIRHLRPRRFVEVGSGFSSCVVLDTNELFFGDAISCTFIEPHPQALLSLLKPGDERRVEIAATPLQKIGLDLFSSLSEGDILCVDSTHVSKAGSDVNYLLFEILPALSAGVHVHFHDIFYPFEYPRQWICDLRISWNEAYLLRAFMQYNDAFKIVLFNTYLEQFYAAYFLKEMPLCMRNKGGSIWLRREPLPALGGEA
jgi:hypothetical protein